MGPQYGPLIWKLCPHINKGEECQGSNWGHALKLKSGIQGFPFGTAGSCCLFSRLLGRKDLAPKRSPKTRRIRASHLRKIMNPDVDSWQPPQIHYHHPNKAELHSPNHNSSNPGSYECQRKWRVPRASKSLYLRKIP